jgi:hypothetical protein
MPVALRLLAALGLAALALAAAALGAEPRLIAHRDVSISQLTRNEARLLLSMRVSTWPDHTPLRVFVLPDDNALHRDFALNVLGVYPYQLRRAWDRQLFSGTGQAPETVRDEAEMLRRVTRTPGAVGYVRDLPEGADVRRLTLQ